MRGTEATMLRSVDMRNKPPGARAIGFVFGAEGLAEQPLLRRDAGEHDRHHQRGDDDADAGAKRQSPAEDADQKTEIGRMADSAVYAVGDQPMVRLDRDQAAEP